MATPFLGEIKLVAFTFAPRGYAFCSGQLLAIAQNDALFALIGTTYGGDGQTTFALPDLRSRVPVHQGTLAGGQTYSIGQQGGVENVTLVATQLPPHVHGGPQAAANGTPTATAANALPASGGPALYAGPSAPAASLALTAAGSSQPHDNMPPFLALNYVIALEGVFPSRN
jgi:microcystin-dependent protein